jgi:hypothetical protein
MGAVREESGAKVRRLAAGFREEVRSTEKVWSERERGGGWGTDWAIRGGGGCARLMPPSLSRPLVSLVTSSIPRSLSHSRLSLSSLSLYEGKGGSYFFMGGFRGGGKSGEKKNIYYEGKERVRGGGRGVFACEPLSRGGVRVRRAARGGRPAPPHPGPLPLPPPRRSGNDIGPGGAASLAPALSQLTAMAELWLGCVRGVA